ncbi:hypothetical protein MMA231_04156 (plasmid) [Asticcacaulis sp. MM231]|uniref:hypothetical protein n=1 Tax=Asticcacaulis sp. MM231 TaxID=3157666 RepID=UPI0032D59A32
MSFNARRRKNSWVLKMPPILPSLSAVCLSLLLTTPFGWSVLLKFGGNYYPEVLLIVACAFAVAVQKFYADELFAFFRSSKVYIWGVICALLLFEGVLMHGNFFAAYSDFRATLLLGIFYCVAQKCGKENPRLIDFLIVFSVSSIVGNLIYYLFFKSEEYGVVKKAFPVLMFVAAIYLTTKYRNPLYSFAVILAGSSICVMSLFRTNLAVMVIMILYYLIFALFTLANRSRRGVNYKTLIQYGLVIATLFLFFPALYSVGYEYLASDPTRYNQTIYKLQILVDNIRTGHSDDPIRAQYPQYIMKNIYYFLMPGGFGQSVLSTHWRSFWMNPRDEIFGSSLDGGYVYLAAHFGIIITCLLLFYLIFRFVKSSLNESLVEVSRRVICLAAALVYFATFGGNSFAQIGMAIGTGLLLGLMMRSDPKSLHKDGRTLSLNLSARR